MAASLASRACVSRLMTFWNTLRPSEAEVLVDFPYLTREDIEACRACDADRKLRVVSLSDPRILLEQNSYCQCRWSELKDAFITKDVDVVLFAECADLSITELVGV